MHSHSIAPAAGSTLPSDLSTARVADLARERPATIRVFQRHRIDFCCGGKRSLAEAAERSGVALEPLLTELRVALSTGAGDSRTLPESLADLGKLIVGRYHVALRGELPRLVQMANRVEKVHGDEMPTVLPPLASAVRALAAELDSHMREEEEGVFPAIERLERDGGTAGLSAAELERLVAAREDEHVVAGGLLAQMRELSGGFAPPEWACNTFRGLYHGLAELETELHEHIHLENNVLFPRALEMATRRHCAAE
jgi:regulator of cell morphogenesis and NO signaling